jgi:membrane associated rhomboid family serine protease
MGQQNFFKYIVESIKNSGMIGRIMAVNAVIYIFFLLLLVGEHLIEKPGPDEITLQYKVSLYFAAPGDPSELAYKPWSIITQMFTHVEFGHFFLNMLVFFFTGRMFVQFFGERRLLTIYLLGGIFAYLFHVAAYYLFPAFAEQVAPSVIGASGSIMAVFMAVAFYRPNLKVLLFAVIPVPLILVAALYLWADLSGITQPKEEGSNIAHFAHLGGALFGMLAVVKFHSSRNIISRFENWIYSFKRPRLQRKTKMKAHKGGNQAREMTDEEFNYNKKQRQERVDAILDKISKKGYEGLTKEEKDFLFNESQRK